MPVQQKNQSRLGADPEPAGVVLGQSRDRIAGQAVGAREGREISGMPSGQTLAGAPDPDGAMAVLEDPAHPPAPQAFALTKRNKTHAVEPGDAVVGPDPQISVPRLRQGPNCILRQ